MGYKICLSIALFLCLCLIGCGKNKTNYKLHDRGYYQLTGVVLTKTSYGWFEKYIQDDYLADIATYDIGTASGPARTAQALKGTRSSTLGRFLYFSQDSDASNALNAQDIERGIRNNHIIPENAEVEGLLSKLKVGDTAFFEGYLADVELENGAVYRTSLSRNDTGAGACEIFVVKKLEIKEKPKKPLFPYLGF